VIRIFKDPETLLPALAEFVVSRGRDAIEDAGRFDLVLSGGSSPRRLYELIASSYRTDLDWNKVYFFFGDERHVPLDHKDSNYRMARETLFAPLSIQADHVFPFETSLNPSKCAEAYEADIRKHFGNHNFEMDLILLGLGDNSHTASLFPNTKVLHESKALVKECFVEEVNMYRITLTAPLINKAKAIAFLVYGKGKAAAVRHILKDKTDIDQYPAQLINPSNGELHWFLDESAAEEIKDN
jgi:6-phosphogluconolactonase